MAENKDYLMQEQESGSVNISEEVIASIAAVSAMEVDGVVTLGSGINFAELFSGKKSSSKGVKIAIEESEVVVDVALSVKYGFVIPTIASKVQDNVINAIDSMTGLHVSAVNVHVIGIAFEKDSGKSESETAKK